MNLIRPEPIYQFQTFIFAADVESIVINEVRIQEKSIVASKYGLTTEKEYTITNKYCSCLRFESWNRYLLCDIVYRHFIIEGVNQTSYMDRMFQSSVKITFLPSDFVTQ